jgi:hypothetical protein
MTEGMPTDVPQARALQVALELALGLVLRGPLAVGFREHVLAPQVPMRAKLPEDQVPERDLARAMVLGRRHLLARDVLAHEEPARLQIHVFPPQSKELPEAKTRLERRHDHRARDAAAMRRSRLPSGCSKSTSTIQNCLASPVRVRRFTCLALIDDSVSESVATLRRYEGKLITPIKDKNGDHRFDPQELAALAEKLRKRNVRKAAKKPGPSAPPTAAAPPVRDPVARHVGQKASADAGL